MPKEIVVSLIGAAVSMALALWSLMTVHRNRALVLAAEESAKRNELVRLKALEAIENFLLAVADLLSAVGGLRFLVQHTGKVQNSEAVMHSLKEIGEKRAAIRKLRIRYAPYLRQDQIVQMDTLFERTEDMEMTLPLLQALERDLLSIADLIAKNTSARFLDQ